MRQWDEDFLLPKMDLQMVGTQQYLPIEDYAVIGDCHTAALVSSTGSIDWYCPGRFDNPVVFCRIVDAQGGGFLKIDGGCRAGIYRKYLEHTNFLRTNISSGDTKLQITQFMSVTSRKCNHGENDIKTPFRIITLKLYKIAQTFNSLV